MAEQVLITSLMRALSPFRCATLAVSWIGLVFSRVHLMRPLVAVALLVVATVFTAVLHLWGRIEPQRLSTPAVLLAELAVAAALLIGDGVVYEPARAQSLPWAWPAAGIAAVGIARGGRVALVVAAIIATVSLYVEISVLARFSVPGEAPAAISKVGLWMLVGGLAGPLTDRLRRAERLISVARAREELARQLHDGVLQTLAVVQRRSGDRELTALARDQENALRSYLSDHRWTTGNGANGVNGISGDNGVDGEVRGPGLEPALRAAASQAERRYGFTVNVLVAPDCPPLQQHQVDAAAGAVGEALTNAAKHGEAATVTVFAEPADDHPPPSPAGDGSEPVVFVSVKDDGSGFEADSVREGIGLSRSIRGRIEDVGGTVEVVGGAGRGTEVMLWL